MKELLLREPFYCTPVCRMLVAFQPITSAIGPTGDSLHVPLKITGGIVSGVSHDKPILSGDDFVIMYPDEKLMHEGRFVVTDPAGDILVWYQGTTLAAEGAYDELLDGALPGSSPCRLSVTFVSTNLSFRTLTRRPFLGVGLFDGGGGQITVTVLSITENDASN